VSSETKKPPAKTNGNAQRILTGTHFMLGDHACAEGALAAGLDFFAGYPITPSTEIAERLAHRMPRVGAKAVYVPEDSKQGLLVVTGGEGSSCNVTPEGFHSPDP